MKTLEEIAAKWSQTVEAAWQGAYMNVLSALRELQREHETEFDAIRARLEAAEGLLRDACAAHATNCRCEWCAFIVPTAGVEAKPEEGDRG